ncbi:hypothetical protein DXX93_01690 [Thalassotalea euphylliae]|uniref:Uncharacterized protein n=1 Tax=Thalassotalea euphylliae TaxID=1655234 RepID=A0A3E0TMX8_9GAMM|nr:hypothetical protein DXX93_01690 [Thalassotalea euphylliae]
MSSLFSLISSTGMQVYTLFSDKKTANENYRRVLPSLKRMISEHGRNSKNAQELLDVLVSLAPFGARRGNFKRRYVDRQNGWRELPDSPDRLPYGVWH